MTITESCQAIAKDTIMHNSVVGLDRDGVINQDLGTYCFRIEDFQFIPGSIDAIRLIKNKGYKIVLLTNQGGIQKGLYTQQNVDFLHDYLQAEIGFELDAIYNSISSQLNDKFSKPNIGMFELCEQQNPGINFEQGYYVGDSLRDLQASIAAKAKTVLVLTGKGKQTQRELELPENRNIKDMVKIYNDLLHFAEEGL